MTDPKVARIAAVLQAVASMPQPPDRIAQADQVSAAARERLAAQVPLFAKAFRGAGRTDESDPDLTKTAAILAAIGTRVGTFCAHVTARPPYTVPSMVLLGAGMWLCDDCLRALPPGLQTPDDGLCDLCNEPVPDGRFYPVLAAIGVASVLADIGACCARSQGVPE